MTPMAPELKTPSISVVVATYNRAETLRETLRHLQAQTLQPSAFEVIVVDDGSPDNTADMVAAVQRESQHEIHYLQHPNRGPGFTQNRGVRVARAPIVLLIADDIFLAPGALQAHLDSHARHAGGAEVAVLGRVLQSPGLTQSVFLTKWDPWHLGALPDGIEMPYYMFWACNISLRREFMLEHGMFAEERGRAGAAAHEDVELGHRLYEHGLRVTYSRDAWGHHHHVETLEGSLKRSYERGLNWHDFRRRLPHPEIDVAYRNYTPATLLANRRELTGARRQFLAGADRSMVWLVARWLQRALMFNRFTSKRLWLPLFAAAERRPRVARWMHENMYRGVIVHYFIVGVRDGNQRFGGSPRSTAVEPR